MSNNAKEALQTNIVYIHISVNDKNDCVKLIIQRLIHKLMFLL